MSFKVRAVRRQNQPRPHGLLPSCFLMIFDIFDAHGHLALPITRTFEIGHAPVLFFGVAGASLAPYKSVYISLNELAYS